MVSDIICIPGYDRLFIFLSTFYMMGVHQVNLRAFYKKLHGHVPVLLNDLLMLLGIVSCICLPVVAIIDEYTYTPHALAALYFFLSNIAYCVICSQALYYHIDKMPADERSGIIILKNFVYSLLLVTVAAILVYLKYGWSYWLTPLMEWIATIMNINFFYFTSLVNGYYSSVHEFGTLNTKIPPKSVTN